MSKNADFDDQLESQAESVPSKMPIETSELGELISLFKESGVSDFEMRAKNLYLKIAFARHADPVIVAAQAPAAPIAQFVAPAAQPAAAAPEPAAVEKPGVLVKSPMVGTFYRQASPESPPYVDVGSQVTEDTVLCIVEAMKIMNEIKAETRGTVAEVLVENGHPVGYGQPMFRIVAG